MNDYRPVFKEALSAKARGLNPPRRLNPEEILEVCQVVAEGLIFVPMLLIAQYFAPGTIQAAATVTLLAFTALTVIVHVTRRNFSFLGPFLAFGGVAAVGTIVAGAAFGFQLGTFFSVAMVVLAGGSILHDTSKVLHSYPEDRYVGAALQLFAGVALMFWYVLRLFLNSRR